MKKKKPTQTNTSYLAGSLILLWIFLLSGLWAEVNFMPEKICQIQIHLSYHLLNQTLSFFLRWRDFTSFLFVQTISREFRICVQNIYFYVPVVGLLEPPEDPELVLIVLPEVIVLPPEVVLSLCCCTILMCSICLAMSLILAALALFDLLLCNLKENIDFT